MGHCSGPLDKHPAVRGGRSVAENRPQAFADHQHARLPVGEEQKNASKAGGLVSRRCTQGSFVLEK